MAGLGDAVEAALKTVGITVERVERWLGKPCGCKERQDKLNLLGYWLRRMVQGRYNGSREKATKDLNEVLEQWSN